MASIRYFFNVCQRTSSDSCWMFLCNGTQRSFSRSAIFRGLDEYDRAQSDQQIPVWKKAIPREWITSMTQYMDYDNIIQNYVKKRHLERNLDLQHYDPKEKLMLGQQITLSVFAHALGGKVKLCGEDNYRDHDNSLKIDKRGNTNHGSDVKVEAIDLSGTDIMYEGIQYLQLGDHLLHLNLSRCEHLTEWSIPRLNTIESLVSLNVSHNQYVTERSILALHHLPNLSRLDISGIEYFKSQPIALALLEELLPNCVIVHNM